jgi:hypothetical protein
VDPREPDTSGSAGCTVGTDVLGDVPRVRVAAELDLLAAPRVERAVVAALPGAAAQLLVDLATGTRWH